MGKIAISKTLLGRQGEATGSTKPTLLNLSTCRLRSLVDLVYLVDVSDISVLSACRPCRYVDPLDKKFSRRYYSRYSGKSLE